MTVSSPGERDARRAHPAGARGGTHLLGGRRPHPWPAGNPDIAGACARYKGLIGDPSTFASMTLDEPVDACLLPASTTAALRERYVPAARLGTTTDG
jgi:hypothetical protein